MGSTLRPSTRNGNKCWLWIIEGFAFVIAQEDALLITQEDVVGIDGYFAAAAGAVDDVLWDSVAGGVATELLDDFDAVDDAGAQV